MQPHLNSTLLHIWHQRVKKNSLPHSKLYTSWSKHPHRTGMTETQRSPQDTLPTTRTLQSIHQQQIEIQRPQQAAHHKKIRSRLYIAHHQLHSTFNWDTTHPMIETTRQQGQQHLRHNPEASAQHEIAQNNPRTTGRCPTTHVLSQRRSANSELTPLTHKLYRVSLEECARLRESVPYVKIYQYIPKHLYPKLNGYGNNGQRSLKLWQPLHTYWLPNTY